jgi:BASS family bile acid:Na+ symporter
MGAAVLEPSLGDPFHPYLLHFMMLLLFLSFLRIDFGALLETSLPSLRRLGILVAAKLIFLPVTLYWLALLIVPDYAIPVLLLSGISTGVVAPFMGTLIAADGATVLRMVIVTSVLVPFCLPGLVKLLAGAEMTIPLGAMIRMLAQIIFLPMVAVLICRRIVPGVLKRIMLWQFPVSMLLFALVNLGVFSKYSAFFFRHPSRIVVSVAVAYVLSVVYYLAGFFLALREESAQRLAAGVSLAILNNVLVIVFASEFFGPLAATVAAMYMFPYYTMIVPAKLAAARIQKVTAHG